MIEEKNLKELIKHQIQLIDLLRLAHQEELMKTAILRLDQLINAIPENIEIPEPLDNCPICNKAGESNE